MGKNRYINTKFWEDPWISDLSVKNKLLFIYLLTNPLTNMAGIYEITQKRISFDTGLDKNDVLKGLKAFESVGKVYYINDYNYVILVNFLKHQKLNSNMKKGISSIIEALPEKIKEMFNNTLEGFESLSNALNNINSNINLNSNPNSNLNINDEEPEEPTKSSKHKYGEYKNVLLKDSQLKKLKEDYGEKRALELIAKLDTGIQLKGYVYKDHNLAIRKWYPIENEKANQNNESSIKEEYGF